jgi:glycine hydroxymethyltransferase
VRIGTPAITTRGFRETESKELAGWIADILDDPVNAEIRVGVKAKALDICERFPVYQHKSELPRARAGREAVAKI